MENKILFGTGSEQNGNSLNDTRKENQMKPNLFLGRTESETTKAQFPDWDIVPPTQFINPRIKRS